MPNPYSYAPKPKSTGALKKILAWILILFGILLLIAAPGFLPRIFGFIAFALPGAWILLHARREASGAQPMRRHWGVIASIVVASFIGIGLTAPETESADAEQEEASVSSTTETPTSTTSTTKPTLTTTSAISTSSAAPTSTAEPTPTREPEPTTEVQSAPAENDESEDDRPIGFTGGPADSTPAPMDKTIDSCGDLSLHETGTTFFTDGTSGWTEQCSNEMSAARAASAPPAPEVVEQAPAAPSAPTRGLKCADVGHKTYIGDGVYALNQDGDGDGVGCESYPG